MESRVAVAAMKVSQPQGEDGFWKEEAVKVFGQHDR